MDLFHHGAVGRGVGGLRFRAGCASFYGLRFLLGAAEAGFFPGVLYYLTLWFPRFYRARFAACLIAAGPFAVIIGGPLSGALLSLDGLLGLHGWQWLFLIEGLPASLLAFSVLAAMPDGPADARWLNVEEKATIARRLAGEEMNKEHAFWPALCDPRVFLLGIVGLGMQSALFGIGLWLPQIVQSMGFSPLATGFVVVPPYVVSAAAMIFWGRASDQAGERVRHLAMAAFLGAGGLFAASTLQDTRWVLAALTIGMVGTHATFGPFWGISTSFLSNRAAAGGVALINSLGSLGGFLAPTYIGLLKQYTGGYSSSMALLAAELVASGVIVLALSRVLPSPVKMSPPLDGHSPAQ
jgi:ACS family tartrate transporter-like MFS transporter